ncbi:ADP-ribose glycohydrolase MACROD1 [Chanos chanos]|uniref:ADP-ribose glycohydrolase MACROD1 n=1 Tax=Chanos chanos TaxID=29144 RepID=A0A6J2UPE7_CHACN|nr:ADP-ribose glycohydrolase MACROD1 [Chanos chanos]
MAFQMSKLGTRFQISKSLASSSLSQSKLLYNTSSANKFDFINRQARRAFHAVLRTREGSTYSRLFSSPPSPIQCKVLNIAKRLEKFSTTSSTSKQFQWQSRSTSKPQGSFSTSVTIGLGVLGFSAAVIATLHSSATHAMAARTDLNLDSDKTDWKEAKNVLLSMGQKERRAMYRTDHLALDQVPVWTQSGSYDGEVLYKSNDKLTQKISLFRGDITKLEIDALVNAANKTLLGGGGVDGAIHRGAGPLLKKECSTLGGCETGEAKITGAYGLPAKYVIHTVGPIALGSVGDAERRGLRDCYYNSLNVAVKNQLRTVAFPCISTGVYGYPPEQAVEIALTTVREFLDEHHAQLDRVIFCVFLKSDEDLYKKRIPAYFPQGPSLKSKL